MQEFTQKYTLIQLLEGVPEGTQFSFTDWPLHSTVIDVFATAWDVPTMLNKLELLLADHEQATTMALDDTFFGSEKHTQVVLLQKTDSLVKLHYNLLGLLSQGGYKPNNPQFTGEGFLPHSTVQKHGRLNKGDKITFDALTLIDMFPGNDPYQRKVLGTIKIGRSHSLSQHSYC